MKMTLDEFWLLHGKDIEQAIWQAAEEGKRRCDLSLPYNLHKYVEEGLPTYKVTRSLQPEGVRIEW